MSNASISKSSRGCRSRSSDAIEYASAPVEHATTTIRSLRVGRRAADVIEHRPRQRGVLGRQPERIAYRCRTAGPRNAARTSNVLSARALDCFSCRTPGNGVQVRLRPNRTAHPHPSPGNREPRPGRAIPVKTGRTLHARATETSRASHKCGFRPWKQRKLACRLGPSVSRARTLPANENCVPMRALHDPQIYSLRARPDGARHLPSGVTAGTPRRRSRQRDRCSPWSGRPARTHRVARSAEPSTSSRRPPPRCRTRHAPH